MKQNCFLICFDEDEKEVGCLVADTWREWGDTDRKQTRLGVH